MARAYVSCSQYAVGSCIHSICKYSTVHTQRDRDTFNSADSMNIVLKVVRWMEILMTCALSFITIIIIIVHCRVFPSAFIYVYFHWNASQMHKNNMTFKVSGPAGAFHIWYDNITKKQYKMKTSPLRWTLKSNHTYIRTKLTFLYQIHIDIHCFRHSVRDAARQVYSFFHRITWYKWDCRQKAIW